MRIPGIKATERGRARLRRVWGTTLCALLVLACGQTGAQEPAADAFALRPGEKDLRRAEHVLARLISLREGTAPPEKTFPGLFVAVADMKPSDLKSELDTAVFLYERAARSRPGDDAAADCAGERPDTYGPLCASLGRASVRDLALAKARLHERWARELVAHYRGRDGAETAVRLAALAAARANDATIAAEALAACRRLGQLFDAQAKGSAGVAEGYGRTRRSDQREAAESLLADALSLAAALPRSPVRYRIEAAAASYRDGLYWASKLERSGARVVSVKDSFLDPLGVLDVRPESARDAAEANIARGKVHTSRAEYMLLEAGKTAGEPHSRK